eukprot:567714-Pleurochrysis_carterae.AAC.2
MQSWQCLSVSRTKVQALPNSRAEARIVCTIVSRRGRRSAPRNSTRDVCLTRVRFADSGIRNVRAPNSKYATTTAKKSMYAAACHRNRRRLESRRVGIQAVFPSGVSLSAGAREVACDLESEGPERA